MSRDLLDRLDKWKHRYGSPAGELETLLDRAARMPLRDARSAIRLHETLLFLRAYPHSPAVARQADAILFTFAGRIRHLLCDEAEAAVFEEPEISGIAGTSLTAVFSYEFARDLARRHARSIDIGWDRYDEIDRLGHLAARFVPMMKEDWPVEAHTPFREWIAAARGRRGTDLGWLLDRVDRPDAYDAAQIPLTWSIENGPASRSRGRLPGRRLFCHAEPLLRRSQISLDREVAGPPLPVRRLTRVEARRVLNLIVDTSAVRYRELYGFSHPEESAVYHARPGRGLDVFFFGTPPQWRLPLRAYHAGMFFKNGVPAGYIETLSLCERAEVGFNLYYTFREGESAWLYAKLLRLCRQMLGVNTFVVDPYQIGHENDEALDSGAFWFYRKLGFRSVDPAAAALTEREETRLRADPGYRSSRRTLEKLAAAYIVYEGPGAEPGAWDRFQIRRLAMRLQQRDEIGLRGWSEQDRAAYRKILEAKRAGSEARYLRLMQHHPALRAAYLRLGSAL